MKRRRSTTTMTAKISWEKSGHKQLSLFQHCMTVLGEDGITAVALPDNVPLEGMPASASAAAC